MTTTGVRGWKINIEPYHYSVVIVDDGQEVASMRQFDVTESLAALCFNKGLELDIDGMFFAKRTADRIRAAIGSVTLDEKEMAHVRTAYQLLRGLPENFIEFLERIRDAEAVELTEGG